jgi:tRNA nucleotidyltransferase (CCA-adding enzyme)
MKEGQPNNPDMGHDILVNQERPLLKAAQDLSRAVAALEPNPDYAPQPPLALIVGGYVRDIHLGLRPKDADIEVYGVPPADLNRLLERMFGKTKDVGEAFGIIKVPLGDGLELDVSIPRRESKAGKGHTGFLIDSDPSLSIQEAARRRDFTVNAMALDPVSGVIYDPFGGLEDIQSKTLRVTDPERFQDDPLRVLRAMQFAARLEFTVEPESARLMRQMVERGDLGELSKERITGEIEKLLLKARRPSIGFEFGRMIGVVERVMPELQATLGVPQEPEWHPEGDVWTHTMMVADAAAKIVHDAARGLSEDERRQVMLGAVAHDLGKPATTTTVEGRIRSFGHEAAGEEPVRRFFSRLSFSGSDLEAAVAVATEHLKPSLLYSAFQKGDLDEKQYTNAVRKAVKRLGKTSWRVLLAAAEADFRGRTLPGADTAPFEAGSKFAQTVTEHGLDHVALRPLIMGRDLIEVFGLKPSPRFGEVIAAVEAARDEGKITTRDEALEFVRARIQNE